VKILVPYGPGGSTDIVARLLADQLRERLNAAFVVENKPGASGVIAIEELARAKPDGYTLLLGNVNTNAITPILFAKKMSINYGQKIAPIMRLVEIPGFLTVTTQDFPPATVAELIAYAKKSSAPLRYGSVGPGSTNHLTAAMMAKRAGVEMVHVPNKSGAAMVADTVRGDTQLTAAVVVSSAVAMVKSGQLRPIAVDSSERLPEYPDVPTMAESGFPNLGTHWQGLFAPAGTPREALGIIHRAVVEALNSATIQEAFKRSSIRALPTASLDEAMPWMQEEAKIWATIIAEVNVSIDD
jgi:tripartite-type tricarboxylate transporter receptor subunit TctC